jgi:hypothetical protein
MQRFPLQLYCLLLALVPLGSTTASADGGVGACAELEARGLVSLRCHGARGDGRTDDTEAIERSFAAARPDKTVFVPLGKYLISRPIDVGGVSVSGLGLGSVIAVGDAAELPLAAVLQSSGHAVRIDRLAIDAAEKATTALHIADASDVYTHRMLAVNAKGPGILLERVRGAKLRSIAQSRNGTGLRIENSSAITLSDVAASNNLGDGIVIDGDATPAIGGTARDSDGVSLVHAEIEQNAGNALTLRNLRRPSSASYLWIENPGDGVRLENVHGAVVRYSRAVGGAGPNQAFKLLRGSSHNLLEANAANHAADTRETFLKWFAHSNAVALDADCVANRVVGNLFDSARMRLPLAIDGGARTRRVTGDVSYQRAGDLRGIVTQRASAPIGGTWRIGDLILHPEPAARSPSGWLCVAQSADRRCKWHALRDEAFAALVRRRGPH